MSSLDVAGAWERKGLYHTQCGQSLVIPRALVYMHTVEAPLIGAQTGKQCWPLLAGVWRGIEPLMQPWCAEGEVPTAANLNLYRGWKSCVGWHCDDEPFVWKVWRCQAHCLSEFWQLRTVQMEASVLSG